MRKLLLAFTVLNKFDKCLWLASCTVVVLAFCMGSTLQPLLLVTSLLGVTALIFMAKGHVMGQLMTAVFSLLYGYISYRTAYYGEMITYLGMTLPMALLAVVSWLKHPFEGATQEVAVAHLRWFDFIKLFLLMVGVTAVFYMILAFFDTQYLPLSTLSIATSFGAAYLTYRRSDLYALAYALNDLVLIALWALASIADDGYYTIVLCFTMFFINDVYAYFSWQKMKKRQAQTK